MSLQEPHLKMSKSHPDPRSRIILTDSPSSISQKITAALTDSINVVSYDPNLRPGVSNLLHLLSYFDAEGRSPAELGITYSSLNLRQFKTLVSETIIEALAPIRTRYSEVMEEDGGRYLEHVESEGAKRARENAAETMALIRDAVGL